MGYTLQVQNAPADEDTTRIERGFTLGTARLCEAMVALGMAHPSPVPDFPDSDHLAAADFDGEQPVTDRARDYLRALAALQVDHGTHGANRRWGIPTHKVSSGDGWYVTADECNEALSAYENARVVGAPHPDAFADDVVPFLRKAARFGGFRVH
ncbi:hypothetical protein NQK81_01310 [Amycolatopsis roodepoortensis]|uniref:hypothetical protein n=1 Tax=Amycolatopsis roodepoortensis TaxID=700274 RepID=UPI00214BACFB|nr:hypothetical protein [Amycolatopsis roodepoortensis]UUV32113.1 hypothetical protein NQK81_01310 [Amycolatopsis roodepoortensis]